MVPQGGQPGGQGQREEERLGVAGGEEDRARREQEEQDGAPPGACVGQIPPREAGQSQDGNSAGDEGDQQTRSGPVRHDRVHGTQHQRESGEERFPVVPVVPPGARVGKVTVAGYVQVVVPVPLLEGRENRAGVAGVGPPGEQPPGAVGGDPQGQPGQQVQPQHLAVGRRQPGGRPHPERDPGLRRGLHARCLRAHGTGAAQLRRRQGHSGIFRASMGAAGRGRACVITRRRAVGDRVSAGSVRRGRRSGRRRLSGRRIGARARRAVRRRRDRRRRARRGGRRRRGTRRGGPRRREAGRSARRCLARRCGRAVSGRRADRRRSGHGVALHQSERGCAASAGEQARSRGERGEASPVRLLPALGDVRGRGPDGHGSARSPRPVGTGTAADPGGQTSGPSSMRGSRRRSASAARPRTRCVLTVLPDSPVSAAICSTVRSHR